MSRGGHRPSSHPLLPKLDDGPFILTTTRSVAATLQNHTAHAREDTGPTPLHATAISFCLESYAFTTMHIKTSWTNSVAFLPAPAAKHVTPIIKELFKRTYSTTGVCLRDATWEAILLFPTLVLGPQCPGAFSFSVKT